MILRSLFLGLALHLPAFSVHAADGLPLQQAMVAVRADDWNSARALARPAGAIAVDIVEWRRLRAGDGSFDDARAFLARHPDWPGLDRIRVAAEGQIPPGANPASVLAFFADAQPATGFGGLSLVQAYAALGRAADAQAQAVLTWRTLPLSVPAQTELLARYGTQLAPHHIARMDAMLWQGNAEDAARMLPLVPNDWQALARARIALRQGAAGVDGLIAAISADLAGDPGLAYDRFRWRLDKGRDDDAAALMDERSVSRAALGQPERWAGARLILARTLMRDGKGELAYRLAANHFLTGGDTYAELEWLAGFISLRRLNAPQVALAHFQRFEAAVQTPISLGRAGYWEGRALDAMGQRAAAQAAYAKGGLHQTSFYGQLAAEMAGLPMDPALTGAETYPDWRAAPFAGSSVVAAARLMVQAGERNLAEMFLTHLAETAGPQGQAQLAGMALSLNEPHIALRIAKAAAGQGIILPRAYFPVTDVASPRHPVPAELVLSIARRESEFNPAVVSGAGARGLMQLMPGTAQLMAKAMNIAYSPGALLNDPGYNARLGAGYLARLTEEFGNNYVLVAAGYNAGPGRPRAWIIERGDPRSPGVDVIDWIETIPFTETRNYVMRVTESLLIYRARLSGKPQPLTLSKLLKSY